MDTTLPYDPSLIRCGAHTGPGWFKLWHPLAARVQAQGGVVHQVKEKFGTLRFYYELAEPDNELTELIKKAEALSAVTCEDCGEPGKLRSDFSWIRTLCNFHAAMHEGRHAPAPVVIERTPVTAEEPDPILDVVALANLLDPKPAPEPDKDAFLGGGGSSGGAGAGGSWEPDPAPAASAPEPATESYSSSSSDSSSSSSCDSSGGGGDSGGGGGE